MPVPYIISVPVSVTVGSRKQRGEKKKKKGQDGSEQSPIKKGKGKMEGWLALSNQQTTQQGRDLGLSALKLNNNTCMHAS